MRISSARFTYFEKLCNGLDEDVEIMWTGALICSSVKNGDFDLFTELTGRKAFMWLNWPVNDYCMDALIMSKGEVLNDRIEYDEELQFTGIVTNPMQQAEPSKLSIFAVADYCWNINDFDMEPFALCAEELYSPCVKEEVEFVYLDSEELGEEEVTELVDKYEDAEG